MIGTIDGLAESVCRSLVDHGLAGRTVTLKIRVSPWRTYTRSRTLPSPTHDAKIVIGVARELLTRFDPSDPVRLLGVGVAGLASTDAADAPATSGGPAQGAGPLELDLGLSA